MNTFKRKQLNSAVITAMAFGAALAATALEPLRRYYERQWCLRDSPAAEIKELETTFTKKMGEFAEAFKKNQDAMGNALEEVKKIEGLRAKTADNVKACGESVVKVQGEVKELSEKLAGRILEVEQKLDKRPSAGNQGAGKSAGQLFAESDAVKHFIEKKEKHGAPVVIPAGALYYPGKTAILNAPFDNNQPLVAPQRLPGIQAPGLRRLTIRDLLPQIPTNSNVVEFARELIFTSGAGPQGGGSSPAETEGQLYGESGITFELDNAVVITLGTWIPASRQVLSDAPALAGYVDSRLGYSLKLEEEDELLNGLGTGGKLNGLRNQATAFNDTATNAQALDTLLRGFTQVELSFFEATGVILHPKDWTSIRLLKDTQGRYLFSDPHSAETPRVWGKGVVPTVSMPVGDWLTGAFDMGAAIYDREGMSIRVSEEHADFFVRGMVAIVCDERIAFVMYRPTAFVAGTALAFPG